MAGRTWTQTPQKYYQGSFASLRKKYRVIGDKHVLDTSLGAGQTRRQAHATHLQFTSVHSWNVTTSPRTNPRL